MKVKQALQIAYDKLKNKDIESYILDAQLILAFVLKIPRWKVLTLLNENLPETYIKKFFSLISLREKRIPLAYIIKQKEFYKYTFYVEEGVLIPRPETELLVEIVLEKIKNLKNPIGIDVGAGSGAICISLLKEKKDLTMISTDISQKAVKITLKNAKNLGVRDRLKIIRTNILTPIKTKVDFIVSNPPYIRKDEYEQLQPEVKKEPKEALIGGEDGTVFYKEILNQGISLIKEGGFFAFEVGYNQATKVSNLLRDYGFNAEIYKDLSKINRVVIGEK